MLQYAVQLLGVLIQTAAAFREAGIDWGKGGRAETAYLIYLLAYLIT
jgi:hypothetical protein